MALELAESLKNETPETLNKLTDAIEATIIGSFEEDIVLRSVMTTDEVHRRFRICAKWINVMRKDLAFSTVRIIDELPKALRHELDGKAYDPKPMRSWIADA